MEQQPYISVVICTYNRAKFIRDVLVSLTEQEFTAADYEIIVVNNNSTDDTDRIVRQFMREQPDFKYTYVLESQQGLCFARNRGIAEAKGEIITYIDDDGIAPPDFLKIIHRFFTANPDAVGLGGKVIPRYETEEPIWMNKYLRGFVTHFDYGDTRFQYDDGRYPIGCNMSYRKQALRDAGGFDNRLKWRADDKQIYFAVSEKVSKRVFYLPELWVEHQIDDYRTTDENFLDLSHKFGSEERVRVKAQGNWAYAKKVLEFVYKLGGGMVLALYFALRGQWPKGKYIIRYRWYALMSLLKAS